MIIENKSFDEERAFYAARGVELISCRIDGPSDGESAFKEAGDITARDCFFNLRYPFWHVDTLALSGCVMTESCRAALWYSENIKIGSSQMGGIKALRECRNAEISSCRVNSPEFGWFCDGVRMSDCDVTSEYFMLRSKNLSFKNLKFSGKYSFQYIENAEFDSCEFDTKDAFWHGKNITVKNSLVMGEYLGWYSENLTFIDCTITGTQPLCYCKGLRLVNCKTENADLSFEKSQVEARVTGHIVSIKNPASGTIYAQSVGEIIRDDINSRAEIITP